MIHFASRKLSTAYKRIDIKLAYDNATVEVHEETCMQLFIVHYAAGKDKNKNGLEMSAITVAKDKRTIPARLKVHQDVA